MTDEEIELRLAGGEDSRTQFKREPIGVARLAAELTAFTNADELPVPKTSIDDVDLYHFGEFLENNYGIQKTDVLTPGKVDVPQKLQNLGLMDGSQLTLAGVMLFGKDPQRYVPVNMVKAVAFVGTSMAGSEYRDSEDFRGTLRDLYKSTMQFILRNLRHVQAGQNFNSIGKTEIPEGAIQELVVNMFLHRDYFVSTPWRVMMFDDRIELVSPGCLPNHLDIEKMKAGVSVARNPLIFNFATKEMPYRGLGTGVQRALELGAKVDFVSDRELNLFKAVIFPSPSVNPSESMDLPVNPSVNPSESVNLPVNLPDHLAELVRYLWVNPTATYDEMARRFSRNRDTVRVYINQLKNPPYSLLRRVGSAKKGHWEVCQ